MTRNRNKPTLFTTSGDKMEWTQIECGTFYTAAVTKKGEVFSWGPDEYNHLGYRYYKTPTRVAKLDGFVINHVSCGHYHMAALTDKGQVLTW